MRLTLQSLKRIIRETMSFPTWDDLSEEEQLLSTYSDVYKEKYGIRPRGTLDRLAGQPIEKIRAALDDLYDDPGYVDQDSYEPQPHEADYYPPMEGGVGDEEIDDMDDYDAMPKTGRMKPSHAGWHRKKV